RRVVAAEEAAQVEAVRRAGEVRLGGGLELPLRRRLDRHRDGLEEAALHEHHPGDVGGVVALVARLEVWPLAGGRVRPWPALRHLGEERGHHLGVARHDDRVDHLGHVLDQPRHERVGVGDLAPVAVHGADDQAPVGEPPRRGGAVTLEFRARLVLQGLAHRAGERLEGGELADHVGPVHPSRTQRLFHGGTPAPTCSAATVPPTRTLWPPSTMMSASRTSRVACTSPSRSRAAVPLVTNMCATRPSSVASTVACPLRFVSRADSTPATGPRNEITGTVWPVLTRRMVRPSLEGVSMRATRAFTLLVLRSISVLFFVAEVADNFGPAAGRLLEDRALLGLAGDHGRPEVDVADGVHLVTDEVRQQVRAEGIELPGGAAVLGDVRGGARVAELGGVGRWVVLADLVHVQGDAADLQRGLVAVLVEVG